MMKVLIFYCPGFGKCIFKIYATTSIIKVNSKTCINTKSKRGKKYIIIMATKDTIVLHCESRQTEQGTFTDLHEVQFIRNQVEGEVKENKDERIQGRR